MNWSFLLLDAVPLLVFVVIDSMANMKRALLWALAVAVCELAYDYYRFGELDEFVLISVLLILVFGGVSIKMDNPVFFKFKPVVLSILSSLFFLVTYAQGKPLLLSALEHYRQALPEQMQMVTRWPRVQHILARASLYAGFGLLLHAGAVAWAALRLSNWWWFAIRSAGAYVMIFVVTLLAMC